MIADDEVLVRTGFRMILQGEEDIEVVGEAENGQAAVSTSRRLRPDIVLMDIRMPVMNGLEATRLVLAGDSACRVIVLTTFDLDEYVYAAVAAGASGFLLKNVTAEQLAASIRLVATGEALLAPSITRRLVERFAGAHRRPAASHEALARLSAREVDVLKLIARGLSNAEVAEALHLGQTTIKSHVGRVLTKLDVRDRVQAVVLAYETGLVEPGTSEPLPS
ncbi:MAG TPA: response regulator transcription factor [Candidatus Dormibacteraeota bacterium]|nr:response regulator transcription factor [Candidatus Dormibacteraeota bacterium]